VAETTIVVAGVMWSSQNTPKDDHESGCSSEITSEVEYQEGQRRIEDFQRAHQAVGYCSCHHHDRVRIANEKEYVDTLQGLEIVAYFHTNESNTTKSDLWLQKKHRLPHIYINENDGYPHVLNQVSDKRALHQQILIYDRTMFYRHELCSLGSHFATILLQASLADAIMNELLATKKSKAHSQQQHVGRIISTDSTIESAKDEIRSIFQPSTRTVPQRQKRKGLVGYLEDRSLLFYHYQSLFMDHSPEKEKSNVEACSSTLQRLYHSLPVVQFWRAYQNFQLENRRNKNKHTFCQSCLKAIICPDLPNERATNDLFASTFNILLGIMLGVLVLQIWSGHTLPWSLRESFASYYVNNNFLQDWLEWLESFPIGFKLNVPLTQTIGLEIRTLVGLHQQIFRTITRKSVVLGWGHLQFCNITPGVVGAMLTSFILGGSGSLALLMDLVQLLTLHLALLDRVFRFVYSTELYLLATLWRLFRGKKRNILRQRTDTMEYDSTQLLVGSFLFVVTLFLWTTILVYYVFFTILNLVIRKATSVVIWGCYVLLRDFPYGTFYLRAIIPKMFACKVSLEEEEEVGSDKGGSNMAGTNPDKKSSRAMRDGGDDDRIITRLVSVLESFGSLIASNPTLTKRGHSFRSWLGSSLSEILSGRPASRPMLASLTSSSSAQ
jgi:hypothetical protein